MQGECPGERAREQIDGYRWAIPGRSPDATHRYAFASTTERGHIPPMVGPLADAKDACVAVQAVTVAPLLQSRLGEALAAARVASTPSTTIAHQLRTGPRHRPGLVR